MNIRGTTQKAIGAAVAHLTAVGVGLALAAAPAAAMTLKANHDHIKIDLSYHGSEVSLRGDAPAGTELVFKITSPGEEQKLRLKGKAGGMLWMNVGDMHLEGAPSLYFLRSTKGVDEIVDEAERERHVIGYEALERHIDVKEQMSPEDTAKWLKEFLKFKESSGLYSVETGGIESEANGDSQTFYTIFDWPFKAHPGTYQVEAYALRDGKVVDSATDSVLVEKVGMVRALDSLAKEHGALYGIVSILIALGSGFGVGMVFRKGGGAH